MEKFVKLRVLNKESTDRFCTIIDQCKKYQKSIGRKEPEYTRKHIQEIDPYSLEDSEIISNIEIDINKKFKNRYELAKYIYEIINVAFPEKEVRFSFYGNPDFWAWFSLIYIEQLTAGFTIKETISRGEHYIPAIQRFSKAWEVRPVYHRHSVRESYRVYSLYKEKSKIYFNPDGVQFHGNVMESIRSRKKCANHPSLNEYINLKYDRGDGFAKRGAATTYSKKKGTGGKSLVRLGLIYKRMNNNYVAKFMDPYQIAERIGPGFELEN